MICVLTVDMPCVDKRHLDELVKWLVADPLALGLMCRVDGKTGAHIEPFPSAFRINAAEAVRSELLAVATVGAKSKPVASNDNHRCARRLVLCGVDESEYAGRICRIHPAKMKRLLQIFPGHENQNNQHDKQHPPQRAANHNAGE